MDWIRIGEEKEQYVALAEQLDWVPGQLEELLERYGIPGVAVGVWLDGEEFHTARGMANRVAGIEATTDTVWLIGSITKVWTTTLIMQMVEQGVVELDTPIGAYLPDLELSDPGRKTEITIRHLLTHTNGITGDYFPDTGRGDDAVARCIATLPAVPMLHQPGEMFSYSNIGFILVGHLIEQLTGQTWDEVIRERLLEPLGTTGFCTLPEEALLHRVGVGHVPNASGELVPGQMWPEVRSGGPAGFTPWATTADLLRFARLHLSDGVTDSGERLLSAGSVAMMQEQHVLSNPSGAYDGDGWGLGWARHLYSSDEPVIGHNGGAAAVLRMLPNRNCAITSLTNAPMGMLVGHRIIDAIIEELFELHIPAPPEATVTLDDLSRYAGTYRHLDMAHHVTVDGDRLALETVYRTSSCTMLAPLDDTTFVTDADVPYKAAFLQPDADGRPAYLHIGGRACRRV